MDLDVMAEHKSPHIVLYYGSVIWSVSSSVIAEHKSPHIVLYYGSVIWSVSSSAHQTGLKC